jgi:hypothetical protein
METIKVIFSRTNTWRSRIIQFHSWSEWSHIGIIDGDYVVEAKGRIGIVRTPIAKFKSRCTDTLEVDMRVICKKRSIALIHDAVLRKIPYDRRAIYGVLFRTRDQDPNAEQCAEFVARVSGVIRRSKWFRITPEEILSICLEADMSYLDVHEFMPT